MGDDAARPDDDGQRAITGRAGLVALGTLASRVLGLARDVTLAAVFSVAITDAFWVAFTLPNALRQLLAEGAVSSAVVPVMAEVRRRGGRDEAARFFAKIRGLSLLALVVASALGVALSPQLVALFANGLEARPDAMARTVTLSRWVFPYILFMGSAALGMAALHTERRFVVASFAPALLNVALVVAALALPTWLMTTGRDPSLALAVGALAGGALQVLAQLPSLRQIGYLSRPRLALGDPDVRRVLARILPMTLGLGIYYVDLIVCRRLLSTEGEGAQSWFSWAQRLCDFPQGIFVMALSTAALPSLASLAADGKLDEVAATMAYALRLALFVALPVTALLVGLSEPIVAAFFERGQFDARSTHETARALTAQGAGVWAVAVVRTLVGVSFALGDTRTPVIVSGLDLLALIGIAWLATGPLGHVGVGVAVTGSSIVQMLLLWVLVARRLPDARTGEILGSAARTALAAGVAVVGARLVAGAVRGAPGPAWLARPLPAIAGGAAFGVVFVVAAHLSRSPEWLALWRGLRRRLGRA
ncbi:MAG: murein biosynthesis integral membrane protein MurJ [Polyangiaceae bacterium]|nr:murein biosynthesis integral membrane protein MurJ [Polyangiaceae bacterium]